MSVIAASILISAGKRGEVSKASRHRSWSGRGRAPDGSPDRQRQLPQRRHVRARMTRPDSRHYSHTIRDAHNSPCCDDCPEWKCDHRWLMSGLEQECVDNIQACARGLVAGPLSSGLKDKPVHRDAKGAGRMRAALTGNRNPFAMGARMDIFEFHLLGVSCQARAVSGSWPPHRRSP